MNVGAAGWFGRPDSPNESAALWNGISSGYTSFFEALSSDSGRVGVVGGAPEDGAGAKAGSEVRCGQTE